MRLWASTIASAHSAVSSYSRYENFLPGIYTMWHHVNIAGISYKCDPAKEARLDIVKVYGYIVELPSNTTNRPANDSLNLYYFDVSRGSNCPRVFPVRNSIYSEDGSKFNPPLYPTPVSAALGYQSIKLPLPFRYEQLPDSTYSQNIVLWCFSNRTGEATLRGPV